MVELENNTNIYMGYINKGKTTIKYQPKGRNIVVKEIDISKALATTTKLIMPDEISDSELLKVGGITKAANLANKSSEDQQEFEIVAIGPEVTGTEIGEMVMFMPGCQAVSIKVKGQFYLQAGEFELMGNFLKD